MLAFQVQSTINWVKPKPVKNKSKYCDLASPGKYVLIQSINGRLKSPSIRQLSLKLHKLLRQSIDTVKSETDKLSAVKHVISKKCEQSTQILQTAISSDLKWLTSNTTGQLFMLECTKMQTPPVGLLLCLSHL